ncbi:MAG TPA: hypothetical protein ENK91_08780 [Bacteroidetes bacterium]|nr:hypothetical protein [Bacteroidota bacterium]
MKSIFLLSVFVLFLQETGFTQVAPESLVKIHSAATTAEMNSITPDAGALLFNSEDLKLYVFDGTSWISSFNSGATIGSVPFAGTSGQPDEDNSNFFWDNTNKRLGIGTNTPSESLEINGNMSITGRIRDSNGDFGQPGQVLSSTATGTDWINNSYTPTPILTNSPTMRISQTKTITFEGTNFIPSTSISFTGFNGTINSTSVLSPSKMEVNITSDNIIGDYDVILSNNGILNTQWPGNGIQAFHVQNQDGTSQNTAGLTCKAILDDGFSVGDGNYWIDPNGGGTEDAFQVYCDMTTDGGGWTKIEYTADLVHEVHFTGGDSYRWLPNNFPLNLTDTQINDIRNNSTEGKQTYQGTCDGVLHYEYGNGDFSYAFGFRFHTGEETDHGLSTYANTTINVVADGCKTNDNSSSDTVFEIDDLRVPIINVYSRDNGDSQEKFGSPLMNNPAWLR